MNAIELKELWSHCPLHEPPYIHPCDEDHLPKSRYVGGYAEYVKAFKKNELDNKLFHLGLLPQPYHGNLETAEVIILLKNPSFHASDYIAEEKCPNYRQAMVNTIRQEVGSHMFLDPRWAWTGGFTWWEQKLREVAWCIAREQFDSDYPKALADLATKVASLELVPYHSAAFPGKLKIPSVPSARKAKAFAQKAAEEDRIVIVPRSVKEWDIKGGSKVVRYEPGQARSASLGPNSPGGQAILKLYGIQGSDCE